MERECDGTVSTTVYRKPTYTDKYLDLGLQHPANQRAVAVKTPFSRAEVVCLSDLEKKRDSIEY